MLDIEIFSVERPIYADGKQIGAIPHLSLGNYTEPTPNDLAVIDSFRQELTPDQVTSFRDTIQKLGKTYFASTLVYSMEHNHHPIVRQKLLNILESVYAGPTPTFDSLQEQQAQMLTSLHRQFRPTHMVAMMIDMKNAHDQQVATEQVTPLQDEIFTRGIAKCVQSIQDLPEKQKSPQIQRFCKRSTHRWKNLVYSARS